MNLRAAFTLLMGSSLGVAGTVLLRPGVAHAPAVRAATAPVTHAAATGTPDQTASRAPGCALSGAPPPALPQGLGVLSGTVQGLDLEKGELQLSSGGDRFRVWAAPWELGELIPGEQLRFRYEDYGRAVWLEPTGNSAPIDTFAHFGTLRGTVRWVHKSLGEVGVQIGGGMRTFRARPEDLAALLPGNAVAFGWVRVGRVDWFASTPRCAAP